MNSDGTLADNEVAVDGAVWRVEDATGLGYLCEADRGGAECMDAATVQVTEQRPEGSAWQAFCQRCYGAWVTR